MLLCTRFLPRHLRADSLRVILAFVQGVCFLYGVVGFGWLRAADQAYQDALDFALVHDNRVVFIVGGLKADLAIFAVEFFEGRLAIFQQCDDGFAVAGGVAFLADDVIAIADVVIDHAIAGHLQDEGIFPAAWRGEQTFDVEGFLVLNRFDGIPRGNAAYQGEEGRSVFRELDLIRQLQRASLVLVAPPEQLFFGECPDVFEDGDLGEIQMVPNLLHRRGIA